MKLLCLNSMAGSYWVSSQKSSNTGFFWICNNRLYMGSYHSFKTRMFIFSSLSYHKNLLWPPGVHYNISPHTRTCAVSLKILIMNNNKNIWSCLLQRFPDCSDAHLSSFLLLSLQIVMVRGIYPAERASLVRKSPFLLPIVVVWMVSCSQERAVPCFPCMVKLHFSMGLTQQLLGPLEKCINWWSADGPLLQPVPQLTDWLRLLKQIHL